MPRVNERIRDAEIRVIGENGEQLGVMTSDDARQRAEEVGLDLVEVASGSRPPVCRIMDFGRYKYEQKKKSGKGKGHAATLKEVKLRPRTDDHDLGFKLKNIRRFLMEGDKVKVTVMYRGREMVHREIGRRQLDRVNEMLEGLGTVENPPRMEGRFLSMILVPNRDVVAEARKAEGLDEAEAAKAVKAEKADRARVKTVEQSDGAEAPTTEQSDEAEAPTTEQSDEAEAPKAEQSDEAEAPTTEQSDEAEAPKAEQAEPGDAQGEDAEKKQASEGA